jgi:hypothetical protein
MKSKLKLILATAALIAATSARAGTYDPIDYDVPEAKSADASAEMDAGSGAGEPRGIATENERESDFVQGIWTSP